MSKRREYLRKLLEKSISRPIANVVDFSALRELLIASIEHFEMHQSADDQNICRTFSQLDSSQEQVGNDFIAIQIDDEILTPTPQSSEDNSLENVDGTITKTIIIQKFDMVTSSLTSSISTAQEDVISGKIVPKCDKTESQTELKIESKNESQIKSQPTLIKHELETAIPKDDQNDGQLEKPCPGKAVEEKSDEKSNPQIFAAKDEEKTEINISAEQIILVENAKIGSGFVVSNANSDDRQIAKEGSSVREFNSPDKESQSIGTLGSEAIKIVAENNYYAEKIAAEFEKNEIIIKGKEITPPLVHEENIDDLTSPIAEDALKLTKSIKEHNEPASESIKKDILSEGNETCYDVKRSETIIHVDNIRSDNSSAEYQSESKQIEIGKEQHKLTSEVESNEQTDSESLANIESTSKDATESINAESQAKEMLADDDTKSNDISNVKAEQALTQDNEDSLLVTEDTSIPVQMATEGVDEEKANQKMNEFKTMESTREENIKSSPAVVAKTSENDAECIDNIKNEKIDTSQKVEPHGIEPEQAEINKGNDEILAIDVVEANEENAHNNKIQSSTEILMSDRDENYIESISETEMNDEKFVSLIDFPAEETLDNSSTQVIADNTAQSQEIKHDMKDETCSKAVVVASAESQAPTKKIDASLAKPAKKTFNRIEKPETEAKVQQNDFVLRDEKKTKKKQIETLLSKPIRKASNRIKRLQEIARELKSSVDESSRKILNDASTTKSKKAIEKTEQSKSRKFAAEWKKGKQKTKANVFVQALKQFGKSSLEIVPSSGQKYATHCDRFGCNALNNLNECTKRGAVICYCSCAFEKSTDGRTYHVVCQCCEST